MACRKRDVEAFNRVILFHDINKMSLQYNPSLTLHARTPSAQCFFFPLLVKTSSGPQNIVFLLLLLHASGAVDAEDLAVDPFSVLGGKEADHSCDVDGLADTVHGGPGGGVLNFTVSFLLVS